MFLTHMQIKSINNTYLDFLKYEKYKKYLNLYNFYLKLKLLNEIFNI